MSYKSRLEQIITGDGGVCTFLINLCQENVEITIKTVRFCSSSIVLPCLPAIQSLYTIYQYHVSRNVTKVFQIIFYLLLTNTSPLDTLKYTDTPIWLWSLLMTWHQTDHRFEYSMVFLHEQINLQPLIKTCWRKFGVSDAFYFLCYIRFFLSEIARLCSFIIGKFLVLYIIHQNNPVNKSLRCIIPWFLRNRSYRRHAPRCRRHAPSYRRHPIKLLLSVIADNFACRRLAANLSGIIVQKREKVRVCRFGARCTMHPCFSVVNFAKRREQAKTFRSERSRRRHLDDSSFARLPPVKMKLYWNVGHTYGYAAVANKIRFHFRFPRSLEPAFGHIGWL